MNTRLKSLGLALRQYIAERPEQASDLIHWPSFVNCFHDAFEGLSDNDLAKVLETFEHDGWLSVGSAGHHITEEGRRLALTGRLLPLIS